MPNEAYKDSGNEWIGEIPKNWNIKKLKYLLNEKLKYGANEIAEFENENDPRYIRITDFGDDGNLRHDTFRSLPFNIAEEYLLKEGDILFARSGATVGKTFQFKDYSGLACFAGYLIKASTNKCQLLSDFLYYYTKSNEYEEWKNSIFNQATIQNIGADKYSILEIPLPTIEEQKIIVNYLDEKTSQIDKLISNKQKLIGLLKEERAALINKAVTKGIDQEVKLKPSGIEWLGDIPEHWEVKKLKYLSEINSSIRNYDIEKFDEIIFLPMENVSINGLINQEIKRNISDVLSGFTYFEKNDVIIAKITPCFENGKGALLENLDTDIGFGSTEFHTLRASPKIAKEFLYFLTRTDLFLQIGEAFMTGSAGQKRVPTKFLKEFVVGIPSINEQIHIIDFVQFHINKIDLTISKIEKEIELMQEYRTALISEVSTGKIKIN